ncbi:hypothetical protein [Methylobacterium ajmalii]|uniref:hypothetical protein n=2 Tax=Methylobacterium ajmalii TaxID=2738439 RepID=UPI00190968C0|nr:hypothetical protein [Methylobacterium ajmalii]MBK3410882.1 hypothetical protein [Methylobacterium ajmalii]MBZ6414913.1 hypothetical protein [Methylobacterium sp.]
MEFACDAGSLCEFAVWCPRIALLSSARFMPFVRPSFLAFLDDPDHRARLAALPARPVAVADYEEMVAHIRLLHPRGGDGVFVLATKRAGFYRQTSYGCRDYLGLEELSAAQFVSVNRFMRRRAGEMLASVGHVWLEFDPYAEDALGRALPYRDLPIEDLRVLLAAAIAAAGLPAPSYWTASGRGLHAVWLCEALPGRAGPKLRRILDALYGPTLNADGSVPARRRADPDRDAQEAKLAPLWRTFRDAGLDRGTQDATRVLRIWGTVNPKSGTLCRRLWPSSIEDIQRCRIDALADAVLPLTGAAFRARMAEKALMPAPANSNKAPAARAYAGKTASWERRLQELLRLREHRGRIAVGQRHAWVFLTANAYAQAKGGDLATWAALLAPLAGLPLAEAADCLGTLGRRQKRHEAGEVVEHGDRAWNPLYHYSGAKMADLLGVTTEEADAAGLRFIRPGKAVALTAIERKAAKRVRDGAVPRSDRADAKLQAGRHGLALRAEGKTLAEAVAAIQASHGRGRTWACEAMKAASEAPAEAVVETPSPAVEPRMSDVQPVRFSGRYIGGEAPPPAQTPDRAVDQTPTPPAEDRVIPFPTPRIRRNSAISTSIEFSPGVGVTILEDKFWGRLVIPFGGCDDVKVPDCYSPPVKRRRPPAYSPAAAFLSASTSENQYRRMKQGW